LKHRHSEGGTAQAWSCAARVHMMENAKHGRAPSKTSATLHNVLARLHVVGEDRQKNLDDLKVVADLDAAAAAQGPARRDAAT
jgi:hypothetical protein